jgi:hypothetical protein
MTGSMTIPQLFANSLSRGVGQSDGALLNDSGQFACRTNETADLDAPLLAFDHMNREQCAAIDLMVEPHIGNPVKKHLRADRRVKHSNHSVQSVGRMNPPTRLMFTTLTNLAERGLSYAEAAWAIDANYRYVARFAKQYGIPFQLERRGPKPHLNSERAAA